MNAQTLSNTSANTPANTSSGPVGQITPEELQLLRQLRERSPAQNPSQLRPKVGERIADKVAAVMGSWRFIIIQSALLTCWVSLNVVALMKHWDPYPFADPATDSSPAARTAREAASRAQLGDRTIKK